MIVWDETRERAIQKLLATLNESFVFGIHVNFEYLKAILTHPDFVNGKMTTQFISKYFPNGLTAQELSPDQRIFAEHALKNVSGRSTGSSSNPWNSSWRAV